MHDAPELIYPEECGNCGLNACRDCGHRMKRAAAQERFEHEMDLYRKHVDSCPVCQQRSD